MGLDMSMYKYYKKMDKETFDKVYSVAAMDIEEEILYVNKFEELKNDYTPNKFIDFCEIYMSPYIVENLKKDALILEDVIQNVFIKLIKEPNFKDESHMKAWLIRVTINQCKDFNKMAWYRRTESLSDELMIPFTKEEQGVLEEVFKLSKNYRNVIYLYYFEGYSIKEIANILNKSENTISSQLSRARKVLKNILLEGGYSNEK